MCPTWMRRDDRRGGGGHVYERISQRSRGCPRPPAEQFRLDRVPFTIPDLLPVPVWILDDVCW